MGSVFTAAHNRVIRRNPFSQGLVIAAVASGNRMLPLVGPEFIPQGGVTSDGLTPNGQGVRAAAATNNVLGMKMDVSSITLPTGLCTVTLGYYKTDTTNRVSAAFGIATTISNQSSRLGAHLPYSDGTVYFDYGGATGNNRVTKTGLGAGNFNGVWSFVSGAAGLAIWQNGVRHTLGAVAVTRDNALVDSFWLFNANVGNAVPSTSAGQDNAVIPFFYLHNRELTASEIQQLHRSPTSPVEEFRGRRTVIILNSGTGAATQTIGASTGTITLSGVTGAIAPSGSAPIGASTGTITLSGVTGAIAPSGSAPIGASTGTITLSGVTGAIAPSGSAPIGAATGTITLTGVAGAISIPAGTDPNALTMTIRELSNTLTIRERR